MPKQIKTRNKDLAKLVRLAKSQGWEVTQRTNNHLKWTSPTGYVYFSSYSPSDFRAVRQIKAALVREGLDV